MDATNFDAMTRLAGRGLNRRDALRGVMAGALAAVASSALLASDEASAKRRIKGGKKGKNGTGRQSPGPAKLPTGSLCESDSQCNFQEKQICDVPQNASNSDHRCCGAQGAICGGVNEDGDFIGPLCCIGEAGVRSFVCSQSDPNTPFVPGTCILA